MQSASPRPLIKLLNVAKIYANGTIAVQDVNLTIGNTEFVSLLGPSGCGKSTLLRLVAGLGQLSAGQIKWPQNARQPNPPPPPNRPINLGFVFQEPTLMPWATVFDNVYLPLKLAGIKASAAREQIMATLATVGLTEFTKAYPRQLSGGMKMRVSIARALITQPSLLLMDEPFAALDEITRIRLNNDLLALWNGQWTVIFVTHSVYESVYLSNRIIVMAARPGRVIADLAIDAPYPRDENYRTSELYNRYCRQVSEQLRLAMAEPTTLAETATTYG